MRNKGLNCKCGNPAIAKGFCSPCYYKNKYATLGRMTYRPTYYPRKYGITYEEFIERSEAQDNRCAICGIKCETLVVDHDHNTGRVRGLLCDRCNVGIGRLHDNETLLRIAAEYVATGVL